MRNAVFRGWWADGQSAARHAVRIERVGGALQLSEQESGELLARLDLPGLRLADAVTRRSEPLRLVHRDWPAALLTIPDHAILERLGADAAHLRRGYSGSSGLLRQSVIVGGATLALIVALALSIPLLAGWLAPLVPDRWADSLGETVVTEVTRDYPVCDKHAAQAALDDLVDRLAAANDRLEDFRARVVEAPGTVNAAAAPGGHMVLFSGLIAEAKDANEVAAVVAHEMAHIIERHPTEGLLRHLGYRLVISQFTGDLAAAGQLAGDAATVLLDAAHSRSDEADADRIGMDLLHGAGLDSGGMARFFGRLADQAGDDPPRLLATHPPTRERLERARDLERTGQPAMTDSEWEALQGICADS